MPSYPFVDFEWLTNILWYKLLPVIGMAGLSLIYSAAAIVSIWIAVPAKFKRWKWLPVILGWSVMLSRFGVRAQVVAWILWALVIRGINEQKIWRKWKWVFPLIMVAWVNLHGSFVLGLTGVLLWLVCRNVEERRVYLGDWIVWSASVAAVTICNPYGIRIWTEFITYVNQLSFVGQTIIEWQPFYTRVDIGLLMGSMFVVVFGWIYRRKTMLWEKVFTGWILVSSLLSLRNAPLFLIAAAPAIAKLSDFLYIDAAKFGDNGKQKGIFIHKLFIIVAIFFFFFEALFQYTGIFITRINMITRYPTAAVSFLQKDPCPGRLFSQYVWGGYLTWRLPQKKVFISGLMSNFKWNAPAGESDQIYKEYLTAVSKPDALKKILDHYNVTSVLWSNIKTPSPTKTEKLLGHWLFTIGTLKEDLTQVLGSVPEWLEKDGWKIIYTDPVSVIFCRY
jgi:hypothetical protein